MKLAFVLFLATLRAGFPDQLIGASLKRALRRRDADRDRRFPDQLIGASLKHAAVAVWLDPLRGFPDQLIGASLKPHALPARARSG